MPNIPPLLSSTPPPVIGGLEDDDDEFGDFTAAGDISYEYDGYSNPSTPEHSPEKIEEKMKNYVDVNSNNDGKGVDISPIEFDKDYQDKRKVDDLFYIEAKCKEKDINSEVLIEENGCGVQSIDEFSENLVGKDELRTEIENEQTCSKSQKSPLATNSLCETHLEDTSDLVVKSDEAVDKQDSEEISKTYDDVSQSEFDQPSEGKAENDHHSSSDLFYDFSENQDEITNKENLTGNNSASEFEENCPETPAKININFDIDFNEPADGVREELKQLSVKDDDSDFGDFEVNFQEPETKDEFGDFANFDAAPTAHSDEVVKTEDDFGDFDSFSVESNAVDLMKSYFDGVADKSRKIIEDAFAIESSNEAEEVIESKLLERNVVFENLKDITETDALKFHWSDSKSQKSLLKALNIDMRNILYGAGWNISVPKFAAALSSSPLEPLKPEILTPKVPQAESSPNQQSEIPTAQFDWTSSGLTNPLDLDSQTLLLDVEQLVASLDSPPSPLSQSCAHWDAWLSSIADTEAQTCSETPSVDLPFTELPVLQPAVVRAATVQSHFEDFAGVTLADSEKVDDDFGPFESIRSEYLGQTNMVPLRESHIFNETVVDEEKKEVKDDFVLGVTEEEKEDDEFDDFQASLPQPLENTVSKEAEVLKLQPVVLEPLKPTLLPSNVNTAPKIEWPDPGISEADLTSFELNYRSTVSVLEPTERVKKPLPVDDDDWTDFVSNTEPVKQQTSATSSPTHNLQLSVLNLNQIRPVKPPVPVITPQGLVQTKLPSITSIPTYVPSAQTIWQQRPPDTNIFQPSLITNQYNKQFYGNGGQINGHASSNDDDDWTDFISSPAPTAANGIQKNESFWSVSPNIITNPGHFESIDFARASGSKRQVPSISALPDLDFVTRSRTFSKK